MQISTFDKWKRNMDKDYSTLTWLCCEVDKKNRSLVCKVCREYEDRIVSLTNFSPVWINGSYNHRTNSIVDHAESDQHKASMDHMHNAVAKARSKPLVSHSPLARSLMTLST